MQPHVYGTHLKGLLTQGSAPKTRLARTNSGEEIRTVSRCIAGYLRANAVPVSDTNLLHTNRLQLATLSTGQLNHDWAQRVGA